MTETLSTQQTTGIVLSTAAQNPLTITSTGAVVTATYQDRGDVTGQAGTAWTVINSGTLRGSYEFAVSLASGGSIANSGLMSAKIGIGISGAAGTVTNGGTVLGQTNGVSLGGAVVAGLVTNTGLISGVGNYGVIATSGVATVVNSGSLAGGMNGVELLSGGTVINSGTISGSMHAVYIGGSNGTLINAGTLIGGAYLHTTTARLVETADAALFGSVKITATTSVLELATSTMARLGTIVNFATSFVGFRTIAVDSGASWQIAGAAAFNGTLTNAGTLSGGVTLTSASILNTGTIIGPTAAGQYGVSLKLGGTVTNAGTITGSGGVYIGPAGGTFVNSGTLIGSVGYAAKFYTGFSARLIETADAALFGSVHSNSPVGVLELAASTAARVGTIANLASFAGFQTLAVDSGASWQIGGATAFTGTLTNAGTLSSGVYVASTDILNTGSIIGEVVDSHAGASVVNQGSIFGGQFAVDLTAGGIVSNAGLLVNGAAAAGQVVRIAGTTGRVSNTGTIIAAHYGVVLAAGGTVTNTGTIIGSANDAISIAGANGTVINSGSLGGSTAVLFTTTGASRLIETADARLSGAVTGSGTSSQLELAASTAGNTGTLGGFDGNFIGFKTIDIDSGASWSLGSTKTFTGTLINSGALVGQVVLTDAAQIINTGSSVGFYDYGAGATIINRGVINGAFGGILLRSDSGTATVFNAGTIGSGNNSSIYFDTPSARLVEQEGGVLLNQVGASGTNNVLELSTGTAGQVGTIADLDDDFSNFATITIDAGATWRIAGAGTFGGTLLNAGSLPFGIDVAAASAANTGALSGGYGLYDDASGAIVTNQGSIAGGLEGILLTHGGSVVNTGMILDTGAPLSVGVAVIGGGGFVGNSFTIFGNHDGVSLSSAGTVTNSGTITGGVSAGVYVGGATGKVVNSGTIGGASFAVDFATTQSALLVESADAVLLGSVQAGGLSDTLELSASTAGRIGTIANFTTAFVGFQTIDIDSGASWTIASMANFAGTVINAGTFARSISKAQLIVNTGSISGEITDNAAGATVVNSGGLSNTGNLVFLNVGGTVGNSGLIVANGEVSEAVRANSGVSSVGNSGTIVGNYDAIVLEGGGTVSNTGTIIGTMNVGVYVGGSLATVINAGTISGYNDAVVFKASQAARLVETSDAVLNGTVTGGEGTNTLELAAGTTARTGTIAQFSTNFVGFQTIDVDSQATWQIGGVANFQGSVINAGTLAGGITLAAANVTNSGLFQTGGRGSAEDALADGQAGAVIANTGTFRSANYLYNGIVDAGIRLLAGGTISNAASGLITGLEAARVDGGSGVVSNAGTITGFDGVVLTDAGTVINSGTVTATQPGQNVGISITGSSGTVINTGSIGGATDAIGFVTTQSARLVESADATLTGTVAGGRGTNTLELGASTAGQVGSIGNAGSAFTAFETIAIDAGASWSIASLGTFATGGTIDLLGAGATIAFGNTLVAPADIVGFLQGESIDFSNLAFVAGDTAHLLAQNVLEIDLFGGGSFDLDLDPGQAFGGMYFHLAAAGAGTQLTVDGNMPCFCRGTRIGTDRGEMAVEALAIGDVVVTAEGRHAPIRWIGHRSYAGRFIAGNRNVLPILIRAGALADGVPVRDLSVSPKHAMFLDGVLIPAELLVNGRSIVQREQVASLTYFHVELDRHDIVLADGAPAESFVDCDSRAMFQNAHEFAALYPHDDAPAWAFCAARVEDGEPLAAVRQRLAARADLSANHVDDAASDGPLEGRIDLLDHHSLAGWAFDATRPHTPVPIEILVNGCTIATTVANSFRADLRVAGKGLGHCAFHIRLDAPLSPETNHHVQVRRRSDGAALTDGVLELPADPHAPGPLEGRIDAADDVAVSGWAIDRQWPDIPVRLEIVEHGRVIGHTMAALYRPDLEQAGLAEGRCSFSFRFGANAPPSAPHLVEVRRAADKAALPAMVLAATRPRALFIDHAPPTLGNDAGSQVVLSHMQAMSRPPSDQGLCP